MRQGQQHRRGRGRGNINNNNNNNNNNHNGNRKGQNPLTRSFESNGPDVKVRGTPAHVAEKYLQLARDAQSSGDHVLAENYLQHAEHYNRIILAYREQQVQQSGEGMNGNGRHSGQMPRTDMGDGDEMGEDGQGGEESMGGGERPMYARQAPAEQPHGDLANGLDEPRQPRHSEHQPRFRDRERQFRQDRGDRPEGGYDRPERNRDRDQNRDQNRDRDRDRGFDRNRDRDRDRDRDRPLQSGGGEPSSGEPREPRPMRDRDRDRERDRDRDQHAEPRQVARDMPREGGRDAGRDAPREMPRENVSAPQDTGSGGTAEEPSPAQRAEPQQPRRRERFGLGADQPDFLRRPVRRPRREPDAEVAPEAPPAGGPPADETPRD